MKDSIEFDSKVTQEDLMNFKVYHNYHSVSGVAALIFGILSLLICIISIGQVNISYTLMMGFFGLFFTVYTPISMKLKVKKQMKKIKSFDEPVHYVISEEGFKLSQNDISEELKWEDIFKITFTGKCFILYITTIKANVISLKDMNGQGEAFLEIASKQLKPFQIKVNKKKLKKAESHE